MKWKETTEEGRDVWKCDPFLIEKYGRGERLRYRTFVEGYQVGQPERTLKAAKEWCEYIAENCAGALEK